MDPGEERAGNTEVATGEENKPSVGAEGRIFLVAASFFGPFASQNDIWDEEKGVNGTHEYDWIERKSGKTDEKYSNGEAYNNNGVIAKLFKPRKMEKLSNSEGENAENGGIINGEE